MNWYKKSQHQPNLFSEEEMDKSISYIPEEIEKSRIRNYPLAENHVDGLLVGDEIPNVGSISSTLDNYEILKGIRKVPFSAFYTDNKYPTSDYSKKVKNLVKEISINKYVNPLIVVIDKEGPYILEGAHRFDALAELGKRFFPALVVIDTEAINIEEFL